MRKRYTSLYTSFVSAIAMVALGCGGGGGGGATGGNGGGTVAQTGGGNAVISAPIIPRTFTFPSFTNQSRLTVVSSFTTPQEQTNTTAQVTVGLSDIGGNVIPRALPRLRGTFGDDTNRCGFADCSALHELMGGSVRAQGAGPLPAIRPRFQDLAEGAQEDIYLVPAFRTVTAEKILEPNETTHCTILAEVVNGTPAIDRARALAIARAFDSDNPERSGSGIYDQVRAVFGSEWNQNPIGGNDGDTKVVIMFFASSTLGSGLFGYTSPADADPNGGTQSNKAEIVYINANKDLYQQLATLAHEFQHIVNFNEKVNQQGLNPPSAPSFRENVSLNEGLSGLAEEVCGYTFESGNSLLVSVVNDYLEKPEDHEFFDFFQAGLGYGQSYLFFRYVREHFGDNTILALCTDPGTGLANLDEHLPGGFEEVFRRWTIANYATNLGGTVPSIYRYPSGLRTDGTFTGGTLVGVNTIPMSNNNSNSSGSLNAWSVAYLTLENEPGTGLEATVTPASGTSDFGVLFEQVADQFTSLQE